MLFCEKKSEGRHLWFGDTVVISTITFLKAKEVDCSSMANLVRKFRKSKNIPIDKLAEMVGGSVATLHRIETGSTKLYHELLPELARVLDCPMLVLAGLKGSKDEDVADDEEEIGDDIVEFGPGSGGKEEEVRQRLGFDQSVTVWRVRTKSLDAMGIYENDLVSSNDDPATPPIMGDPVIIRVPIIGGGDTEKGRLLLRQYIEPDIFITNSKVSNKRTINKAIEKVRIVGTITSKVMRPAS